MSTSSCAPLSRRTFLTSTTSAAALAAAACGPAPSGGGQSATTSQTQDLIGDGRKRRILLRGGVVLTLDPKIGDFENADVLIDGKTIAQVAPNLAPGDAEVIDCAGTIVMPGFVTTHHHQYETHSTQHHRGRSACGRMAAGDISIGRPEHLDGGANRRSRKPEQGHLGPGPCSIRSRGLLHLPAHRLPERDQSGHHNGDGHITVQPHARTHRRHDQGADGFRTPNGVRLQRRDQSKRPEQAVRVPGRDERHHERNRPDREDVFQLEGPTGHAWLRRRPGGSVRRRPYTGWQLGRAFGASMHNHIVGNPMGIVSAAADARNGMDWSDVTFIHATRWQDAPRAQIGSGASGYPNASRSKAWESGSGQGRAHVHRESHRDADAARDASLSGRAQSRHSAQPEPGRRHEHDDRSVLADARSLLPAACVGQRPRVSGEQPRRAARPATGDIPAGDRDGHYRGRGFESRPRQGRHADSRQGGGHHRARGASHQHLADEQRAGHDCHDDESEPRAGRADCREGRVLEASASRLGHRSTAWSGRAGARPGARAYQRARENRRASQGHSTASAARTVRIFWADCCFKGQNTTAPEYALRP